MGHGKKIFYYLYNRSHENPQRAKKILTVAAALALIGTVLAAVLVYSAFMAVKHVTVSPPDLDLVALKELTANKGIVMTEPQRAEILLLARKLTQETLTSAERADLRGQLLGLLEPGQLKQVEAWKAQAIKQAGEFTSTPRQIAAVVERATGISAASVKNWLDGVLAWWKIKQPGDNVQGLAEALEEKK